MSKVSRKMSPKIKEINFKLRTLRKLKGEIFAIEHLVWKVNPVETMRIEAEISRLEKQKIYIKRNEELKDNPNYQHNNNHNGPNIEEVKQIPIRLILETNGISIGRNNFFKLRKEKTASAQFNNGPSNKIPNRSLFIESLN
jgi:hypothetical protein